MVALYHLGEIVSLDKYFGATGFAVPFHFGSSGVFFFFVLSGFIIALIHFKDINDPARLVPYAKSRITRIYPPYWIVFTAVFVLATTIPTLRQTIPHDFVTIVRALVLLPTDGEAPVLGVAWTLQYEVCFYAFFGLFIFNRPLGLSALCLLLGNFVDCHFESCGFIRDFAASNLILLFGLGCLVAWIAASSVGVSRPLGLAAVGSGGFLLAGMLEDILSPPFALPGRALIYAGFSALLILGLVRSEDAGLFRLKAKIIENAGEASYSLYLLHQPLMSVLCKAAKSAGLHGTVGAAVTFPIVIAVCVASALIFNTWIERPFIRIVRRAWSARNAPARILSNEKVGLRDPGSP